MTMNKLAVLSVALLGATAAFAGDFPVITDGLAIHLDASDADSLTIDDDGYVTEWRSSVNWSDGSTVNFVPFPNPTGGYPGGNSPVWDSTAGDNHGGVLFGYNHTGVQADTQLHYSLPTNGKLANRVVFIVAEDRDCAGYANLYGYPSGSNWASLRNKKTVADQAQEQVVFYFWRNAMFDLWACDGLVGYDKSRDDGIITSEDISPITRKVPHVLRFASATSTMSYSKTAGYGPVLGHHRNNSTYFWRGPVFEVLVYSEILTSDQIAYIEAALDAKWLSGAVHAWKGGASGNWSDAANWSGGVPGDGEVALVDADADITVDVDVKIANFIVPPGRTGSLISNGKKFIATRTMHVPEDYTIDFSGTVSFGPGGSNRIFYMPKNATVNGTLRHTGGATIRLRVPIKGAFAYEGTMGDLDLNGVSQSFVGLSAQNALNGIATPAKMSVGGTGSSIASALTQGDVSFERVGTGEVELRGRWGTDSFAFSSGVTVCGTARDPDTIPGCTLHLDAQDADTLTIVDGQVREWRSKARLQVMSQFENTEPYPSYPGMHVVFRPDEEGATASGYEVMAPFFVPDLYNGKPGVRFGSAADGSTKVVSQLRAPESRLAFKSYFLVFSSFSKPTSLDSYDAILVPYNKKYGIQFNGRNKFWAQNDRAGTSFWINGVKKMDGGTLQPGYSAVNFNYDEQTLASGSYSARQAFTHPALCLGQAKDGTFGFSGSVSELICYDRDLTDAERQGVENYLLKKWGIDRDPKAEALVHQAVIPATASVTVGEGASIDLNGAEQKVAKVTVEGSAAVTGGDFAFDEMAVKVGETLPTLLVDGDVDVTEAALEFFGGKPESGKFLKTTGTLTGPFESVTGTTRDVRYTANSAKFPSGLLLFLR